MTIYILVAWLALMVIGGGFCLLFGANEHARESE